MDVTLVNTAVRATSDSSQNHAPAPHLVLVLESRRPAGMSARYRLDAVDEIILGRGKQRTAERRLEDGIRRLIIQVPDPWMSSRHARIERRGSLFLFQDTGSTNGSMINGAAITSSHLQDGDTLELGQTFFLFRQELAVSPVDSRDLDVGELTAPPGLISLVPRLSQKLFELAQVSRTSASVVVQGETGTGKEVIARSSHTLSGRAGGFVAVNCGALPDALVESELFGYKKGAFSGATEARQGFVQAADHGTLFLDEIGDLPLSSQAVLLRVLQEREVTPVGSTKPIPVDFRLVSATHRDMEGLVREGRFREDLLARLSGFTIELPPLRERMEDMGILIASLLAPLCAEHGRELTLSNDAMRALLLYSWPRNVRELRTCLQTAAALAADGKIHLQHLSQPVRNSLDSSGGGSTARGSSADSGGGSIGTSEVRQRAATQGPSVTMQEQGEAGQEQRATGQRPLSPAQQGRRDKLIALLREHQGNVSAVARSMGKVRSQVQRWLKRYGLDPDSFRDS